MDPPPSLDWPPLPGRPLHEGAQKQLGEEREDRGRARLLGQVPQWPALNPARGYGAKGRGASPDPARRSTRPRFRVWGGAGRTGRRSAREDRSPRPPDVQAPGAPGREGRRRASPARLRGPADAK